MKVNFLIITGLLFAAAGCGSGGAAINQNAAANTQPNVNAAAAVSPTIQPTPTQPNQPAEQSAEVPTFDNSQAALEAGKKYFDKNEDENAVKAFQQAVQLDANSPEAHFQLAIGYDTLDQQEDAEKSFNNAIKSYLKYIAKNPKDAAAKFNLGRAYSKINEDEKSRKSLEEAVKLQPDDSEYHLELGSVLIKLAQYDVAVKELKKCLALDPENARAEAALEKADAGDKRVKAAKAQNKDSKTLPEKEAPVVRKSKTAKANANTAATPTTSGGSNSNAKPPQ